MRAGPEVSVAATKSYTAQRAALMQIINLRCEGAFDDVLSHAHLAIGDVLLHNLEDAVALCSRADHAFFMGRGPFYPVAMEGALKMKEISTFMPRVRGRGAETRTVCSAHPETPVVAICTPGPIYNVMVSTSRR